MKVILAQDVRALGKVGDLVKVSDGYARNYLIPRRLALAATEDRVHEFAHLKKVAEAKKKKAEGVAKKFAEKLSSVSVTLKANVGEGEKLFGSITTMDIAKELDKQGYAIDRRDLTLEEPIKQLGQYKVKVKVATGVDAHIKVVVERE